MEMMPRSPRLKLARSEGEPTHGEGYDRHVGSVSPGAKVKPKFNKSISTPSSPKLFQLNQKLHHFNSIKWAFFSKHMN